MQEVTAYKMITEYSQDELNEKISDLIMQGWQPFGSASVNLIANATAASSPVVAYSQPMVKY